MSEIKSVLVTGNQGYIGSVLTPLLVNEGYSLIGLDTGFYEGLGGDIENMPQIRKDIREITQHELKGIDAVIHLAALSNDPLGELNKGLTKKINLDATVRLAQLAKKAGVRRFVYASSQSMYGISDTQEEIEEDNSEKKPITEYAKTKWEAELGLKKEGSADFIVVCFRPSTVFGVSPKLRCDIVFNNLIACGYTTGKIEIKSDGTPWRPAIHIKDVSRAFIAGLRAPQELIANESFNVGIEGGNYTIRELAETAQRVIGEHCKLTFTREHGSDARTYRVSFRKILHRLKDYYKPEWDIIRGGKELVEFFDRIGLDEDMFRSRKCNRLAQLNYLIHNRDLDENLFWREL